MLEVTTLLEVTEGERIKVIALQGKFDLRTGSASCACNVQNPLEMTRLSMTTVI